MYLIEFQFQMEMRTGGHTSRTNFRYGVSYGDGLSLGHTYFTTVSVEGFHSISMVQLQIQAIGIVLSHIFYRSRRKGLDWVARLSADVYYTVKLLGTIDGMISVSVFRVDIPKNRCHGF